MLTNGQVAPDIDGISISGQRIDLKALRGRKVLVKFHRFSGCPVAQEQIHALIGHQRRLNDAGIETIVLMHCTKEKIVPLYNEVAGLHILPDKAKTFYRRFGSRFRWRAMLHPASWVATFRAILKGNFPRFGRFQGGLIAVPSDLLIDERGVITHLHYGKHFGDSWSAADVLAMT